MAEGIDLARKSITLGFINFVNEAIIDSVTIYDGENKLDSLLGCFLAQTSPLQFRPSGI